MGDEWLTREALIFDLTLSSVLAFEPYATALTSQ